MANYTLIPSAIGYSSDNAWYEDPDYAYHNTSWTRSMMWIGIFADVGIAGNGYVFLKGFDFSNVDTSLDYSVTVKVKAATVDYSNTGYVTATLYSSENGVALSQETTLPLWEEEGEDAADPSVTTLTLTAPASTIILYGGTVGIKFRAYDGPDADDVYGVVWGAEIILTEIPSTPKPNKIIYGNKKLIDLTSVSVTPEKVAEGYIFHLANGRSAMGSAHVGIYVATVSSSSSTNRQLSFTQLEKEPSWFLAVCTSRSARNNGANNILYNGSSTKVRYNNSAYTEKIISSTSYASFTYSAGTLTITLKTTPYFGVSDWELYYI